MKVRHPWLLKLLGFGLCWVVRLWLSTVGHRRRFLGPDCVPSRVKGPQRYLYAFWHEYLLVPFHHYLGPSARVLISQHADGELIAEACRAARSPAIRGSTTRGGIEALRRLLRASRKYHLGVIPDGPRGPRRQIKPGLIFLAARTGLPVVVVGVGYRRPWRLRSWDRFALPRPGSSSTVVTGVPIHVPADLDDQQFEHYRRLVEDRLNEVSDLAERWAETGRWPAAAEEAAGVYDECKRSA